MDNFKLFDFYLHIKVLVKLWNITVLKMLLKIFFLLFISVILVSGNPRKKSTHGAGGNFVLIGASSSSPSPPVKFENINDDDKALR